MTMAANTERRVDMGGTDPLRTGICGTSHEWKATAKKPPQKLICTRKPDHPGTHYDDYADTWFGPLRDPSGVWLRFVRREGPSFDKPMGRPGRTTGARMEPNPKSNRSKHRKAQLRRGYD